MSAHTYSYTPRVLGWEPDDDTVDEVVVFPLSPDQYLDTHSDASSASPAPSPSPRPRIPRPRNEFIIFRCEYARAHAAHGAAPITTKSLSLRAAEAWRRLPPPRRAHYRALAAREKEEHERKYPDYRYRPDRKRQAARGVVQLVARRRRSGSTSSAASVTEASSPEPATPTPASSPELRHPPQSPVIVPSQSYPQAYFQPQATLAGYPATQGYSYPAIAASPSDDAWHLPHEQYEPAKQYNHPQDAASYQPYMDFGNPADTATHAPDVPTAPSLLPAAADSHELFSALVHTGGHEQWEQSLFDTYIQASYGESPEEEFARLARPLRHRSSMIWVEPGPDFASNAATSAGIDELGFRAAQLPMA
ncbi:hypothetical protein GLOTRDRAFT_127199 [Gloeophyllum trabeum ATCC 11539]|uniref:HMG box domain-containing protein n=1 Tax=Gloeophyllum trabeum (strain ATCC 11539 / FP-39264 / Madison 617) TaxID=670483 RepID=S7QHI0_GLOTA|nr:uncharacterized protein GLOTRDRAFT_127199 [Gloeophyllum trabeum ATCC 11539]EPQ58708.1 hypothetical protein GLOTRDRAFT_127199 [Gloeophyllum trabeum ATCC 11539]